MSRNRLAHIILLDVSFAFAIAVLLTLGTPEIAKAYVDPSVMTYTVQALAGVAVALSAVLGVVWRRLRKKALSALEIDESAGKYSEPDVSLLPADADTSAWLENADTLAIRDVKASGKPAEQPLPMKARVFFAAIVAVLLVFTLGIVAPLEIVAGGGGSLLFGVRDVWLPLVLFACALSIVLTVGLSFLNGKAYDIAIAAVFAIALCCYLQASLLNVGLPPADGKPVPWDDRTKITLLSAIVWISIIVLCVAVTKWKSLAFKGFACFASVCLVAAQGYGLVSAVSGASSTGANVRVTMNGMFDVSDKSNIAVFCLDTFDTRYMEELLEIYPELTNEFSDFTFYRNSTGSMTPTRYGVPYLATGKMPVNENSETMSWSNVYETFAGHNLLDELNELGYQNGVYSADINGYLNELQRNTENVRGAEAGEIAINPIGTISVLWQCAVYRDAPWLMKRPFWFYTDDVNNAVVSSDVDLVNATYTLDDPRFYSLLQKRGLEVSDDYASGTFRLYHLFGAHYPFYLNEDMERVPESETNPQKQRRGSLKIVSEYIKQLKSLGVYDQTTIIVTADHGYWNPSEVDSDDFSSPLIMIKEADEDGGQKAEALETSDAQTGHLDLPATIVSAAGGDVFGWGVPVDEAPSSGRIRTYYATKGTPTEDRYLVEWEIDGDALSFDDWNKGRAIPFQ